MRVDELAAEAGTEGRYAQEWLEQQAVAGVLDVERDDHTTGERRFTLPPAHAEALAVADSPNHVAPFGPMIVGIAAALPEVVAAYRSGGGVPYERYGADFREGQGAVNRPAFVHQLRDWLAAAGEVHERLSREPPARVADMRHLEWLGRSLKTLTSMPLVNASVAQVCRPVPDAAVTARTTTLSAGAGRYQGPVTQVASLAGMHLSGHLAGRVVSTSAHSATEPVTGERAARGVVLPRPRHRSCPRTCGKPDAARRQPVPHTLRPSRGAPERPPPRRQSAPSLKGPPKLC